MNSQSKQLWTALISGWILIGCVAAEVRLPSIIADNMVLQQQSEVPIWGWARPGERVTVTEAWDPAVSVERTVTAGRDGRWMIRLKTPGPGGPYTLTIKGDKEITLNNILIGEVWFCSGQSNMEWPTIRVDDAQAECAAADYPQIRLFMVEKATAVTPRQNCTGTWKICSPDTVQGFSGVGYFFARRIHRELDVPVGMIGTYWGGTPAEAWTSRQALEDFSEFEQALRKLDEEAVEIPQVDEPIWKTTQDWNQQIVQADPGIPGRWYRQDLDDSDWDRMPVPLLWENSDLGDFDGIIWYRKDIEIPADWAGSDLVVELGPIDDADITWFNGKQIGQTEDYQVDRKYTIPAEQVRIGTNRLAVRVLDTGGGGGLWGKPEQLKIYPEDRYGKMIALAGGWKYKIALSYRDLPGYRAYKPVSQYTPTALYNAMIAPLIPYGIRGALWYQGESNCGRHDQYKRLIPAMVQDWRDRWGRGDFPFYYVQIAPYNYSNPDDPMSALLREAQMHTLSFKNSGMAVTMDIGDPKDIHPRNKQDVGNRLALWALAKDYGQKDLVYSGPLYKEMKIEGDKIRLFFDHVGSGLMAKGENLTHFTIAGEDRKFVPAEAVIDGDTIVVSGDAVSKPVAAVRYAFTNAAQPNLFNKEGLPASSFRTDTWK